MEWLLEHFDALLPVALVLLFLFQRMFVRDEESGQPADPELESEARRIQEEIRRKIVARQQGRAPSAESSPWVEEEPPPVVAYEEPPVFWAPPAKPTEARTEPPPIRTPEPEFSARSPGQDLQDALRRERERLREARQAKADALRRTSARGLAKAASAKGRVTARRSTGEGLRADLLADLATPDSLKRAFLLKEIVDRPIGLRSRPDAFSNWS